MSLHQKNFHSSINESDSTQQFKTLILWVYVLTINLKIYLVNDNGNTKQPKPII